MKEFILRQLEKLGFLYRPVDQVKFLDKEFRLIRGTFRQTQDKDDAWLFELSKHHKTIFDVGSNIGQAALLMLYNGNVERIVLIDPNPKALSWAAENIIMNNLSPNARFIPAFISDKSGVVIELYTVGVGAAGSKYKGFAKTASRLNSHYTAHTITLDDLSDNLDLLPDFVKIDVEGAESEVLTGAVAVASHGAIFFVEIHSGPELSIIKNTEQILEWCLANDYRAWYLKNKDLLNIESIKSRGRYHSLLLPKEQEFPEYLKTINEGSEVAWR